MQPTNLVSSLMDGLGNKINRYEEGKYVQLRIKTTARSEKAGIDMLEVERWYWRCVGRMLGDQVVLPTEEEL
jgi:hypothetical protein